jgi:hypothetical protein
MFARPIAVILAGVVVAIIAFAGARPRLLCTWKGQDFCRDDRIRIKRDDHSSAS